MENQKGFTILEVIITTAIMLVISSAILLMLSSQMRAGEAASNYMVVSEQNQRALQKMAEELRGTDKTFLNVSFTGTPQGTITLPSLIPSGSPETVTLYPSITFKKIDGFDTVDFCQVWSSNIIFRRNSTSNQVERVQDKVTILANHVSKISFYNAPGRIGIILTCEYGNPNQTTDALVSNRMEVFPLNAGTD